MVNNLFGVKSMKKKLFIISILVLSMILSFSLVACGGGNYEKDPIIGSYTSEDEINYIQIINCKAEKPEYEDETHFKLTNTYIFNEQFFSSEIIISYSKKTNKYTVVNDNDLKLIMLGRVSKASSIKVTLNNLDISLEYMENTGSGFVKREITFTRTGTTIDEWKAGKTMASIKI